MPTLAVYLTGNLVFSRKDVAGLRSDFLDRMSRSGRCSDHGVFFAAGMAQMLYNDGGLPEKPEEHDVTVQALAHLVLMSDLHDPEYPGSLLWWVSHIDRIELDIRDRTVFDITVYKRRHRRRNSGSNPRSHVSRR